MVFDHERFQSRHIGPDEAERDEMLKVAGASSLDSLINEAIPPRIRLKQPPDLPDGQSEYQFLRDLRRIASRNRVFRSYLGPRHLDLIPPAGVLRHLLRNPRWLTPN